jgi:thiaminase
MQAWTRVGEGLAAPKYQEFVERWGSPEFADYVVALAAQADEALAAAPADQRGAADAVVKRVLEFELAFWNMAYHQQ